METFLDEMVTSKFTLITSDSLDASPLVVCRTDGTQVRHRVYIGSHFGTFACINCDEGNLIWSTQLEDRIERYSIFFKLLQSSSAAVSLDGKVIYVACYGGKFYALKAKDGSVISTFQAASDIKSSPYVDPLTELIWVRTVRYFFIVASLGVTMATSTQSIRHCHSNGSTQPRNQSILLLPKMNKEGNDFLTCVMVSDNFTLDVTIPSSIALNCSLVKSKWQNFSGESTWVHLYSRLQQSIRKVELFT